MNTKYFFLKVGNEIYNEHETKIYYNFDDVLTDAKQNIFENNNVSYFVIYDAILFLHILTLNYNKNMELYQILNETLTKYIKFENKYNILNFN